MILLEHTKRLAVFAADILFPKRCISCGGYGVWFCDVCSSSAIENIVVGACAYCKKTSSSIGMVGGLCATCRKSLTCNGLLYLYSFKDPTVERLIHVIKYSGVVELLETTAITFKKEYLKIPYVVRPEAIADTSPENIICVPVPLHKRKLRMRGFNQSVIFAEKIAQLFGWSYEPSLVVRKKYTISQTTLSREERKENMQNAFTVSKKLDASKLYLIIDDVITTGTTIAAVAEALRVAGAKTIWVIAIARG